MKLRMGPSPPPSRSRSLAGEAPVLEKHKEGEGETGEAEEVGGDRANARNPGKDVLLHLLPAHHLPQEETMLAQAHEPICVCRLSIYLPCSPSSAHGDE